MESLVTAIPTRITETGQKEIKRIRWISALKHMGMYDALTLLNNTTHYEERHGALLPKKYLIDCE